MVPGLGESQLSFSWAIIPIGLIIFGWIFPVALPPPNPRPHPRHTPANCYHPPHLGLQSAYACNINIDTLQHSISTFNACVHKYIGYY